MTPVSSNFTESSGARAAAAAKVSPESYGRRALLSAFAIATVMLCSYSVLMLSPWCKSVLAFTAFTALLLCHSPAKRNGKWLISSVLYLAGMYVVLRLESAVARVVMVSWLLLLVRVRSGARSDSLVQMHWAGLGYACFLLSYGRINGMWFALRRLGEALSGDTPMGLWVSGFQVYAMGAVAGLACMAAGRPKLSVLAGGATFAALGVAFVAGRTLLAMAAPVGHLEVSVLHGAAVVIVALTAAGMRFRCPGPGRVTLVSAMLMLVLLVPGLSSFRAADPPASAGAVGGSIGLCSEGLLDWRVPDMERLGLANSGMFGLLKEDLEAWTCPHGGRVIVSDSISEEFLSGLRVFIVINPSKRPTKAEIAGIERFVREGNALLILGDHTNIGDSRGPLNAILGFTGIRFNHDSAVPLRPGWQGCLEVRPHPVTRGVSGDVMPQIGVGASLEITRPAVPLVIARYGFSDAGDDANVGRGGYMGNIVHEGGEEVGDLVLAACEDIGRGRVLVFGDTSPFQNAALFFSRAFVRNSIAWLQGDAGAVANVPGCRDLSAGRPEAVVDFSLKPDVSLAPFSDRSLGGLANCLARAGITAIPALGRSQWNPAAPFLFLINPTGSIGAAETEWLRDYMVSGGNVILAKGHASPQPVEALVSELGLKINPIPLGGGDGDTALAHKDAWAISSTAVVDTAARGDAAGVDVRSRAFGYPTAVSRRVGAGTFTLIADGRVFLDENLEDEWRGDSVNIAFIMNLTGELRRSGGKGNAEYAEARTD